MDKPVHTNPSGHKENLCLCRPDGPAEPPAAACVSSPLVRSQLRLERTAEAPSSAVSGGSSGSSQHPGPRTRNYFPTCSRSRLRHHPASRDVAAPPARRQWRHGPPRSWMKIRQDPSAGTSSALGLPGAQPARCSKRHGVSAPQSDD